MLTYKVVAGDGNVDVAKWRVGITKGNHRDVDIGCLRHSLWSNHRNYNREHLLYMTSGSYISMPDVLYLESLQRFTVYCIHLVVGGWVSDNEKAWLAKSLLDLIGECSGSEPAGDGVGSGVVGKLQDGPLQQSITKSSRVIAC